MTTDREKAMTQLTAQAQQHPELAQMLGLQAELLELQLSVSLPPMDTAYQPDEVNTLLDAGAPLLQMGELQIDEEAFADLWTGLCNLSARYQPNIAPQAERVRSLLRDNPAWFQAWLTSNAPDPEPPTEADAEVLSFVLINALRPFMWQRADALRPLLNREKWQQSHCPVCGSEPNLAYLNEEEDGARYLVCERCDTEWRFPRVACPFCGNTDAKTLGYFVDEEHPKAYRLYVCEECKHYLKTIDLRETAEDLSPIVWRVLTVSMDLGAQQEGYIGRE